MAGTNKRSLLVKVTYKRKSAKIRVVLQRIQRHPHAKTKYRVSTNNQLTNTSDLQKQHSPVRTRLTGNDTAEDQKNSKTKTKI